MQRLRLKRVCLAGLPWALICLLCVLLVLVALTDLAQLAQPALFAGCGRQCLP